jgi:hypothetical protein
MSLGPTFILAADAAAMFPQFVAMAPANASGQAAFGPNAAALKSTVPVGWLQIELPNGTTLYLPCFQ